MRAKDVFNPIKVLSFVVLAAMVGAIVYASSIALLYWNGIGV